MNNEPQPTESDRVDEIVATWLESKGGDCAAERDRLMRQHPEFAEEISSFVTDYVQLDRVFAPLRAASGLTSRAAEMPTMGWNDTGVGPSAVVGQAFGDYELLAEIARGGMGIVYKARQKCLNRIVALKMVLAGSRDRDLDRDRFLAEARAVARLTHPNIVPIYEVGEHGGQQYFTMQFLPGGSLREQISEFQHLPREVAKLMTTIARAVEHAHRRGILHRDLKPSNVLLDDRRQPHVTDFGLAKQLDEASDLTQAGTVVGTPSYMSPEQASGQADLTTAADVYGLGALLYELLTGQPPFKAATPLETLLQVMSQEPRSLRQIDPTIERDLETICLKCLEKEPGRRYGSAESLAEDLDRWLGGEPIVARAANSVERVWKWARRQPLLAGSAATSLIVFIALLVTAASAWNNAELRAQDVKTIAEGKQQLAQVLAQKQQAETDKTTAEKLADEQRKLADQQQTLATKIEAEVKKLEVDARNAEIRLAAAHREARRTLYAADMQLAHAAWLGENMSQANSLLQRYQARPAEEDVRGFEWHYLQRLLNGARNSWSLDQGDRSAMPDALALSADGKLLATGQMNGLLKLWNVAPGRPPQRAEIPSANLKGVEDGIVGLFFSDEAQRLTTVMRKDIGSLEKIIEAAVTKKEPPKLEQLSEQLYLQTVSLQGTTAVQREPFDPRRLAGAVNATFAGGLFLLDSGNVIVVSTLVRSPDGKYLAIAGSEAKIAGGDIRPRMVGGKVHVWDLENNHLHAQHTTPTAISAVAFSAHDRRFAIATADGAVGLARLDLKQPPQLLSGHRGLVYALRFSGDGHRLASASADGSVILWDVASAKEHDRLRGHSSGVLFCEFSPSGDGLYSCGLDGAVKDWDLKQTQRPPVLTTGTLPVAGIAISANGQELIAAPLNGDVQRWSFPSYRLLGTLPAKSESVFLGRLSQDGTVLVLKDNLKSDLLVKDLRKGTEQRLVWKDRVPHSFSISADNRYLASGDISGKGGIGVWNLADGQQVATLDGAAIASTRHTFSRDGKTLAIASKDGVVLWNWQTKEKRTVGGPSTISPVIAYSPDEQLLVYSTRDGLDVWNLREERRQASIGGPGQNIRMLAFTPDGRRLAAGGLTATQQGLLKLYDTESGREVFAAQLPPSQVTAVAFHPHGSHLFVGLAHIDPTAALTGTRVNCEVRVWEAAALAGE